MLEEINRLIETRTAENNGLALALIQNKLALTFKEAFLMLKIIQTDSPKAYDRSVYYLNILNYHISYRISEGAIPGPDIHYIEIERRVSKNDVLLNDYTLVSRIEDPFFIGKQTKSNLELLKEQAIIYEGLEGLFLDHK